MVALLSIATVVVLGTCGFGGYLLVRDENTVVGEDPNAVPTIPKRDITSRKTDPDRLKAADVFPTTEIVVDPAYPPYKRVGAVQINNEPGCRIATVGAVGDLLSRLGCNQVIRATFTSPDGQFVVTAGLLNLRDAASAMEGHNQLSTLIGPKNRLTGYIPAGGSTKVRVLGTAPTSLAWNAQGHFLLYTVVARFDGKEIPTDDEHLKIIVYDMLQKHLRDTALEQWMTEDTPTPATTG